MTFLIDHWNFSSSKPKQYSSSELEINKGSWYHCQRDHDDLRQWLLEYKIPTSIVDSLLTEDTRPLFEQYDDENFLLILRGVNMNDNANPEDMISVRILYFNHVLFSTHKVPSKAISAIRDELQMGYGPQTLPDVIVQIIDALNKHIDTYLDTTEASIIAYDNATELTDALMQTHKALLKMKRFIKPQQYAIDDYCQSNVSFANNKSLRLRHSVNTITRINETLDFYLGELELIKGELRQYHAEKMTENTYLFSIITAIFLPTTFLTGLLGVNIDGIPGTESPIAFTLFCLGLVVIFGLEVWILYLLRFWGKKS